MITTQYRKQFAQLWTHKNGGSLRQIDHFVLEQDCRHWARNAESSDSICLGGDHRAVKLEVLLAPRQRRMRPQTKKRGCTGRGWKPHDKDEYKVALETKVKEVFVAAPNTGGEDAGNVDKCRILEEAILNVAGSCSEKKDNAADKVSDHAVDRAADELQRHIKARKELRASGVMEGETSVSD